MRLPREALPRVRPLIRGPPHDPPVLVAAPHHAATGVHLEAERRRRPARLPEGRGRLVAPARPGRRRAEGVREVPHPDPGLARGPQAGAAAAGRVVAAAGERAERRAGLRLLGRARAQLERGRAVGAHRGARGRAVRAGGRGGGELREGARVVRPRGRGPDGGGGAGGRGGVGGEGVAGVEEMRRLRLRLWVVRRVFLPTGTTKPSPSGSGKPVQFDRKPVKIGQIQISNSRWQFNRFPPVSRSV